MSYLNLSLQDMEGEVWKPIDGYEGLYEISNKGRVKALERIHNQYANGVFYKTNKYKSRIKKQAFTDRGYLFTSLSKGGETIQRRISRLVAQAFIPNPENKDTVNHKDGIKIDNTVEFLEWHTQGENNRHALTTGLRNTVGENVHWAKLKKEKVVEIFLDSGTDLELSKKYGVPRTTISHIRKRQTWKSVTNSLTRG